MSEIDYRAADRSNADELRTIAYTDSRIPLAYDPSFPWSEKSVEMRVSFFRERLEPEDYFDVAVSGSKIVGFHIIRKVPYLPELLMGDIVTLWVDPDLRGQGIGTTLKRRGEDWARAVGISVLQTSVHRSNEAMLSINRNEGLEIVYHRLEKQL